MFGEMRPESTKIFQQSNPCCGVDWQLLKNFKKSDEKYESIFHIDMNAIDSFGRTRLMWKYRQKTSNFAHL